MDIESAVARSMSHTERVRCGFDGDYGQLRAYISDTFANGNSATFSEENDGTIDIHDIDDEWRICVTLEEK